jgi:hypothetical protein
MTESHNRTALESSANRASEIDRIRDIIVGPYFEHTNAQLAMLVLTIDHLRDSVTREVETLKQQMLLSNDSLREDLQRIANQLDHGKVDRATLGEQLIRLGQRLQATDGDSGGEP